METFRKGMESKIRKTKMNEKLRATLLKVMSQKLSVYWLKSSMQGVFLCHFLNHMLMHLVTAIPIERFVCTFNVQLKVCAK